VYASGVVSRPGGLSEFDVLALKLTPAGDLVWERTFSAGEVVDPRGGMDVAPDGSVVMAGAIQAEQGGLVGINALVVKLDGDGSLLFAREWGGSKAGAAAGGVTVGSDGSIYVAGGVSGIGAGNQDAFVVRMEADGKAGDAVTWGRPEFESGADVGVSADGAIVLAASITTPPEFSLREAPRKVGGVKGTFAPSAGVLADAAGVASDPGAAVITPDGSTTYQGNFETALIRFVVP
jgi:hypothetical protein